MTFGPQHGGPFVAWVKDVKEGEVAVMVGEQTIVHKDANLAKQLAQIAARAQRRAVALSAVSSTAPVTSASPARLVRPMSPTTRLTVIVRTSQENLNVIAQRSPGNLERPGRR